MQTPIVPDDRVSAYHMFYVLLADRAARDRALARLTREGIKATFHYVPLHSSEAGIRFSARRTEYPVTDEISGRLLRLPFYNELSDRDARRVVKTLLGIAAIEAPVRESVAHIPT
jgi:dTDP-4-amino-4,6-dideoxygalactose transaminase